MPLRVAIVTPTLSRIGGTEIYLARALEGLRGRDVEIRVYTSESPGGADFVDGASVKPCGDALSESLHPAKWVRRRAAVRQLAGEMEATADIVDFHRLAPLDLLRALRGRVPAMLSLHTAEITCPAGGRLLPKSGGCCTRSPGLGCIAENALEGCLTTVGGAPFPFRQRVSAAGHRLRGRFLLGAATGVRFNSAALRKLVEEAIEAPEHSSVVHPPLDDAGDFRSVERDPGLLLFVGRLVAGKGGVDAVQALRRLDPSVRLEIVGDGPDRQETETLAESLGVSARVRFRGWLSAGEVAEAQARAGCMLFPSRLFECFGMAGPEAVSRGCPVVAYDVGGAREWCLPRYGTLVSAGDVEAMASAAEAWLRRVASGEDTSKWRAEALRRWGVERFSREFEAGYREVLGRG